TVTDANSCEATHTFIIEEPTALTLTPSQTDVSCFGGNNGTATVSVSGGTPGYTYSWLPYGGTAATASDLAAGTYTVTITDANSCQTTETFTISEPSALSLTAASQTNIACFGGSDGAAAVNAATGGAGGYTYEWTPGSPIGDGTTAITGLVAGTYTCTVTDLNGCTASVTFTVIQPDLLAISVSSQTDVTVRNGTDGT